MEKAFNMGDSIARENVTSKAAATARFVPALDVENEINMALKYSKQISQDSEVAQKMKKLGLER